MRVETLLTPGLLSNGIRLRIETAKAISAVEIVAGRTPGGKTTGAKLLYDFLTDAASKLSTLYDVTVPTFGTATAASATKVTLAFSETMDETVTPLPAAFTSSGNTITAVAWGTGGDAGKLVLTGTGFAAAETVAYTKPATNALRDRAGNQVATNASITLA